MKKIFILSIFLINSSLFSQEVMSQKTHLYKEAAKKYLNPIALLNELRNKNLSNYNKYLKNSINKKSSDLQEQSNKCSVVCPENFDILKRNSSNYEQIEKNTLTFLNSPDDFEEIMTKEYGFCWGHASLTNQLRNLAFFDPENTQETTLFTRGTKEWRRHINSLLRDVFNFKPRVFPHLSSIEDLSLNFEEELKILVTKKWAKNAISIDSYINRFRNKNTYKRSKIKKMMEVLQSRLELGQTPEVIFNIWDSADWIHVSLVSGVSFNKYDSSYTIELDDNKLFNNDSNLVHEKSKIHVDLISQKITYNNGVKFGTLTNKIGRLALTDRGFQMYNKILPRLRKFCMAQTNCDKN